MHPLRLACLLAVRPRPRAARARPRPDPRAPQCLLGALAAPPNVAWFIEPISDAPLRAQVPATFALKAPAVTATAQTFTLVSSDPAASFASASISVQA